MIERVVAVAFLGTAAAAASAQSSVTLYGIVDVGVQYNTFGVNRGTSALPNWQQESNWGVDSGYQSGSRLGFRGSEALGGGLSAIFTLEAGFDVGNGMLSQSGQLFGRQAWAGLQGRWGTLVAGRIATPSSGTGSFDMWGPIDPFVTGWNQAGVQATFIPSNALREDNAILYQTPTWGGFRFAAQYSFNIGAAETAPREANTSAWNVSGSWSWGPLYAAVTYDVIQFPDPGFGATGGLADQKMLQAGLTWDFKFVKLHAAYADQKNIAVSGPANVVNWPSNAGFVPTGASNYNNRAYMLGVSVPLLGGKLLASYQDSNAKNIVVTGAQFEPDYQNWGIGFEYPLSRRTNFYVGYAQRTWDGRTTLTSGGALTQAAQLFDRDQFALGLRHLF
jgi:predicted porin